MYRDGMSAQPTRDPEPGEPYEVIHLGGEAAAIVPLPELRRLRAIERHASAEILEEAEIEATLAGHRSGWPLAALARSPMRRRWPNCPAALNDHRVVSRGPRPAGRYLADQDGMRAIGAAVVALAPSPLRR